MLSKFSIAEGQRDGAKGEQNPSTAREGHE